MLRFALVLAALLASPPAISARTWQINADGTGDAPTIQAAVDSAAAGDAVVLAAGVYREFDIQLAPGVSLKSASGDPTTTVIDAEQRGRVLMGLGLDDSTLIEGITIANGRDQWGAGFFCESGSPIIRRCVFLNNYSESAGYEGWGGGLLCYFASPLVEGCVFRDNRADWGGGAYCHEDSNPIFRRCLFDGNSAFTGGGLFCHHGTAPTISYCTFVGNSVIDFDAFACGAGIGLAASSPVIEHTIIAFSGSGCAIGTTCPSWPPTPTIECCNLYGNADGDWVGCEVEDQATIDGNFSADPLFCATDADDFHLQWASPCLPANSPDGCGLIGAFGFGGCNSVSVTPESWARVKARYR